MRVSRQYTRVDSLQVSSLRLKRSPSDTTFSAFPHLLSLCQLCFHSVMVVSSGQTFESVGKLHTQTHKREYQVPDWIVRDGAPVQVCFKNLLDYSSLQPEFKLTVACQQCPSLCPRLSSSLELQIHGFTCFLGICMWLLHRPLKK